MFWDKFLTLCTEKKISPTRACLDMGFSNATAAHWKKGSKPTTGTLCRVADYFNVRPDYFAEDDEKTDLYLRLFKSAPEEDRNYVLHILQKLHDVREENQ